ncbi:MAG: hypothetical protein R3F19_16150 [Verrucomicrobiales bacterium]
MSERYVKTCILVLAVGLGVGAGAKWLSQSSALSNQWRALPFGPLPGASSAAATPDAVELPTIASLELLIRDKLEVRAELLITEALKPCPTSHIEKLCRQYASDDTKRSLQLWSVLVQELAARDSEKALAIALNDPTAPVPEAEISRHFRQLVASNPDAAIAQMRALERGHLRDIIGKAIVEPLYQESPTVALQFAIAERIADPLAGLLEKYPESIPLLAAALRDNQQFASLQQVFAREWGTFDADAALDWAQTLKSGSSGQITSDLLTTISYKDPLRAFDQMAETSFAYRNLSLLEEMIPRMMQRDFEATLSRLTALSVSQNRWYAFTLMAELLRDDPLKAAAVAGALEDDGPLRRHFEEKVNPPVPPTTESLAGTRPSGVQEDQITTLLFTLAEETRFDDGAKFIGSLPGSPLNLYGIEQFARQWAGSAPQKAAEWASTLEVEGYRKSALAGLIDIWGYADAAAAAAFASELPDDATGQHIKARIAGLWAQQKPLEALQWAAKESERTLLSAANIAAMNEPVAVAGQFSQLFSYADDLSSDAAVTVASQVAENWAKLDPTASLTWVQNLPQGRARDEAESFTLRVWAALDSHAASEAVTQMPVDRRDPAATGLVQAIAATDPEAAWEWSMAIEDEEWRKRALDTLIWNWQKSDPERALERIVESSLPAKIKANLTERLK